MNAEGKLTAALVVASIAVIIAIPALVIAAINTGEPNTSNTVNINAVPGQTDITGGLNVSGAVTINRIVPASSTTTGSLVTAGGIGCAGQVVVGLGVFAPFLDSISTLNIGTSFQTGINVGRTGLPVTVTASQFNVVGTSSVQNVVPRTTVTYDVGSATQQWNNFYLGGLTYNASLFPTQPTGGIYSMTSDGPTFTGGTPPLTATSVLGATGQTSLPTDFTIPADTMAAGDSWNLQAGGSLSVSGAINVTLGIYVNGAVRTQAVLVITGAGAGVFNFAGNFTIRTAGASGTVIGNCRMNWNDVQDQDILSTSIDTTADMLWDLRVTVNAPGTNLTSFQTRLAIMQKSY